MANKTGETFASVDDREALEEGLLFAPRFGDDGLIPAIVTDQASGQVLMFAWMNGDALAATLQTSCAHFWSRSRQRLWKKGEESGNVLRVLEMRTDCDQDVVWLVVDVMGDGVACHTKRRSCFYRVVEAGGSSVISSRLRIVGQPV